MRSPPAGDINRYNLGPWTQSNVYRSKKGLSQVTTYKCFMNWRSKCPRQIRIVRQGKSIELHSSRKHLHDEETKHRLTVKTLTSIRTAVKHNITKSATEIRRVVCCEETPLDVRDHRKVQRAVVKARDKEILAAAPLEIGFSMRGTLGSIKQYAAENDMKATLAKQLILMSLIITT